MVPSARVVRCNPHDEHPEGRYVLYWMIAARRPRASFALDHALARARALRRPLLVLEPLRRGYPWASPRIHSFLIEGMADQRAAFARAGVTYVPYVEPRPGEGRGLLAALAADACLVVTDLFPAFFLPRMVAAAAARLSVRLEQVDGNGLLPLSATPKPYPSAATFRRHLQKELPRHLGDRPVETPLADYDLGPAVVPSEVAARWPAADRFLEAPERVAELGLSGPAPVSARGGSVEGRARLDRFLQEGLSRYQDRNHPDADAVSGLSPWLHFGHVGIHEVVDPLFAASSWTPERLGPATGAREGWWGLPPAVEKFLDELVTWRELGYSYCYRVPNFDTYGSLPGWARDTLARHAADPRPVVYSPEEFASASTHDPLWNAAQRQLLAEGHIHNYLRMLWGKKVLEWSATPERAWETLIDLNNRYAIDGRDPNSYTGIGWIFGRFDRPWPERPIYGTVRSMSSDSTLKKVDLKRYLARWGGPTPVGRNGSLPFGSRS